MKYSPMAIDNRSLLASIQFWSPVKMGHNIHNPPQIQLRNARAAEIRANIFNRVIMSSASIREVTRGIG